MSRRVVELESASNVVGSGVVWRLAAVVTALTGASREEAASRIEVTGTTSYGPQLYDAPASCRVALDDDTRIELDATDGYHLRFAFDVGRRHGADEIERAIRSAIG